MATSPGFWKLLALSPIYQGCYEVEWNTPLFDANPGGYDPSAMTPAYCAATCGAYRFTYAAVASCRFCFCGDTYPTSPVADSGCQEGCAENGVVCCGGRETINVYNSSSPITSLAMSHDAAPHIQTGITVTFNISASRLGGLHYYQMDYDDGAGWTQKFTSNFQSRAFHLPGMYKVRVLVNDLDDTLVGQEAVTTVNVEAPAADLEVDCDPEFVTHHEGKCEVTVWQGTALSFTADIDGQTTVEFTSVADPLLSQVGPGVPSTDSPPSPNLLTPGHQGTVVAMGSLVERAGRVIGWELNAQTTGTAQLLILSPFCEPDVYCPVDNACAQSCSGAENVHAVSCSGSPFCPRKLQCDDGTCTPVQRFSAVTPNVQWYQIKRQMNIAVSTLGYQYTAETDLLQVEVGDVLGMDINSSSAALFSLDCPADHTDYLLPGPAPSEGGMINSSELLPTGGDCLALRAVVSGGSKIYLPFTFYDSGTSILNFTARTNSSTSSFVTRSVMRDVREGINFAIIVGPTYLETFQTANFSAEDHSGKPAYYTWNLDDGLPSRSSHQHYIEVSFHTSGSYNVTVIVANIISSQSNSTIVQVQDRLTGLTVGISVSIAETRTPLDFTMYLTGGSHYTCEWNFGDGSASYIKVDHTYTTIVSYTYNTTGHYNVSVNCSNSVSMENVTTGVKVQERISGLRLTKTSQDKDTPVIICWRVTTGSDIVWHATLNGQPLVVNETASSLTARVWSSEPMGHPTTPICNVSITASNGINSQTINEEYFLITALASLSVGVENTTVLVGSNVTFKVFLIKGMHVNITVIYNDGSDPDVGYSDWVNETKWIFRHAFRNSGLFSVEVRASTKVKTLTKTVEMRVTQEVMNLTMHTPSNGVVLYDPPAHVDVWFELPPGSILPWPPLELRLIHYVYEPMTYDELQLNHSYSARYDDVGEFNITAEIFKSNYREMFVQPVVVIDILEGPQLATSHSNAPRGQPMTVTFTLYRGPSKPYCRLTWDFGDPDLFKVTDRTGSGENGQDTLNVTYKKRGAYNITVTATSPLQTVSVTKYIQVIEPVTDNFTISFTQTKFDWLSREEVEMTIYWTGSSIPDQPLLEIDWGDGDVEEALRLEIQGAGFSRLFKKEFLAHGLMNTAVTMYNQVSSVNKTVQLGVYADFEGLHVTKCFMPGRPRDAPCQYGLSGNGSVFPSDRNILFQVTTTNNASATNYTVRVLGSDLGDVVAKSSTIELSLQLGSWTVEIQAVNPFYNRTTNTTVTVAERIVGFSVTHDPDERKVGGEKTFTITFDKQGSNLCLAVDFGDDSHYVYASDSANCPQGPPFEGRSPVSGVSSHMSIGHVYRYERTFTLTATAFSQHGIVSRSVDFDISDLNCSRPVVHIENACETYEEPCELRKSNYISMRALPLIHCSAFGNNKQWTIELIHSYTEETQVTSQVDLMAFGVDTTSTELTLKPRTLDYGVYKVTFSISMITGVPGLTFRSNAYSYVKVEPSYLVGRMLKGGATAITRGSQSFLALYPLQNSYDPDVTNTTSSSAGFGLEVINWTCSFQNGSAATECQHLLSAASVGSQGRLYSPLHYMTVGETYTINATLWKTSNDGGSNAKRTSRKTTALAHVFVASGNPCHVIISCTPGSMCHPWDNGVLVPVSTRLGLQAECLNCTVGEDVQYDWTIFIKDYRWPDGWRLLQDVHLAHNRTKQTPPDVLSIFPAFFEEYLTYGALRVNCTVTRRSGSTGDPGWAMMRVIMNQPPSQGQCHIEPKVVTVTTEKLFRITCIGWTDETEIEEYQFYSFFDQQTVPVQITSVRTITPEVRLNVTLSQGARWLDFTNQVFVAVKDRMKAISIQHIDTVKVYPEKYQALRRQILDVNATLTKMVYEGVLTNVTELATILCGLLNSASQHDQRDAGSEEITKGLRRNDDLQAGTSSQFHNTTSSNTESTTTAPASDQGELQQERDERTLLRASLLKHLLSLPNNTMLGRTQILSAIAEALRIPTETTGQVQDSISKALHDYSKKLDDGEATSPLEREDNMNYILAIVGLLMDAMGTTGFSGTLTELEQAEHSSDFKDYPTDNSIQYKKCLRTMKPVSSIEEAYAQQVAKTNCEAQEERVKPMSEILVKALNMIRQSYMKNSITGDHKQFNSDRMRTLIEKTVLSFAFSVVHTLEFSEAQVKLPPDMQDAIQDGTLGANDTILMQMSENSNSPHRYTSVARGIPVNSRIVSFVLFKEDKDGPEQIHLAHLRKPVRVKIPVSADAALNLPEKSVEFELNTWNQFQLHRIPVDKKGSSIHAKLCLISSDEQFVVVISLDDVPKPQEGQCHKAVLVPPTMSAANKTSNNCYYVDMDNEQMNDFVGKAFFGVRKLQVLEHDLNFTSCKDLPDWSSQNKVTVTSSYTLSIFASGCYSFSEGDEDWATKGCKVQAETTEKHTVCECTHLADSYAGGWTVTPNTIDFNFVFANSDFLLNPTLYVAQIVVGLAYVLALVWARRKDRRDIEKLGVSPLMDNDPEDRYYYEINVVTGMRRNAGTESKVYFVLSGEDDETGAREFSDSRRKIFGRGNTDGFLLATPRPLGSLNYARIWHDNSGKGAKAGWYLSHMVVRDVQTNEQWVFLANRWFAVEEDDGQVDRILPVATQQEMREFTYVLAERTRQSLVDGHLWLSVFTRPPQSRFTRVQRVSCCLCLLYVTMLANAMFYKKGGAPGHSVTMGPFSVSVQEIYKGVISNLIVFPVNFLIITFFRKSRFRRLRPSRLDQAIRASQEASERNVSVDDVKPEVRNIFSISRPVSQMSRTNVGLVSSLSRPLTVLSHHAESDTKKKKWCLPWWCRIVAWLLLWLSTACAVVFVNSYGISFKDETCRKWLFSMLVSVVTSVFFTQPIKVVLFVMVFTLLCKRAVKDEKEDETEDEEQARLAHDEIPLHNSHLDTHTSPRTQLGCKPPDRELLQAARETRLKEIQMWAVVRELAVFICFLLILLVICYRMRNSDTFLYKNTMEQLYIKSKETATDVTFDKIRNAAGFWNWTRSGLVNGIRAGPYYNDFPPFLLQGYVNDKESKMVGYATMRQLRVKPNLCEMDPHMMAITMECNVPYSIQEQEDGTFGPGWTRREANASDDNTTHTHTWYRFSDADSLEGYPHLGLLGLYAGGGYLVPLRGPKADLITLLNTLEQEDWIDRYTRAVFVEFTTYNAQVNLFGIATILAEFHPTGDVVQSYRFEPAMLLPYMTSTMIFHLVCEGIFACFIVFFLFRLVVILLKEKLAFFKGFWNWVDVGILAISVGAIVLYLYRLFEANKLTKRVRESRGESYIKFQYVGYCNELFTGMLAWTVFLANIKFLRLLRFNKRMSLLAATLRAGSRSLLHFSVIFSVVFLAFCMLFFHTFMTVSDKYSSFVGSMVAGVLMMMGKFDIYALFVASPFLTQVFVFLYVVSLTFIIVNMFVSIVSETFSAVLDDVSKQSNDHEIIDFILSRFSRFIGLTKSRPPTLPEEERSRYSDDGEIVEELSERVNRLLAVLGTVVAEKDPLTAPLSTKRGLHCSNSATDSFSDMGFGQGGAV